jgi:hypothetical protein
MSSDPLSTKIGYTIFKNRIYYIQKSDTLYFTTYPTASDPLLGIAAFGDVEDALSGGKSGL